MYTIIRNLLNKHFLKDNALSIQSQFDNVCCRQNQCVITDDYYIPTIDTEECYNNRRFLSGTTCRVKCRGTDYYTSHPQNVGLNYENNLICPTDAGHNDTPDNSYIRCQPRDKCSDYITKNGADACSEGWKVNDAGSSGTHGTNLICGN